MALRQAGKFLLEQEEGLEVVIDAQPEYIANDRLALAGALSVQNLRPARTSLLVVDTLNR